MRGAALSCLRFKWADIVLICRFYGPFFLLLQDIAARTTKGAAISAGKRWRFPNYWHNITQHFEVGGKQVELEVLLFDSVVMMGR